MISSFFTQSANSIHKTSSHKGEFCAASHCSRQYKELNKAQQSILKTTDKKFKISVRNEVVVLGLETDKKKIKTKSSNVYQKNIEDVEVKYNSVFWNTFNFPPPTEFYKKKVKEFESIDGMPLETQFNLVNKQ